MIERNQVDASALNAAADLPFELRLKDFELAMQDIYDFFHDVNTALTNKGLQRLDDMLRPARSCRACFPTCSRRVWPSTRAH